VIEIYCAGNFHPIRSLVLDANQIQTFKILTKLTVLEKLGS
jgi:hypothetical protein